MTLQIFDMEQGSPEWFAVRAGIPTASEFSTVMAKGEGKTRMTYMRKLAGEILTGRPMESYSNAHMERGKEQEPEARAEYEFTTNVDLLRVGFVQNGPKGCSPDSLIGATGALEVKTALPHILIEKIERDAFPPEHKAQCQGVLWIAEREWIDLAIYCPCLPLFVKRATRDEAYIKNMAAEVDAFNAELAALVHLVKRYGMKEAA